MESREAASASVPSLDISSPTPLGPNQLDSLRGVAQNIEGDLPHATVERDVAPDEAVELTNSCMEESGWPVDEDGAIAVPPEQEQAYWTSMYLCRVRFPPMERYLQPLDTSQWTVRYDHWTGEYLPCLAVEGIHFDTEPPTLEVFLNDPFAWRPTVESEAAVSEWSRRFGADQSTLDERCPPEPPLQVLYPPR